LTKNAIFPIFRFKVVISPKLSQAAFSLVLFGPFTNYSCNFSNYCTCKVTISLK